MTPEETAQAREAGYRLLAALLRGPLTAELVAAAAIDPRLAVDTTLDDLAAEHLAAFDHGAFPHAGVFLDPDPSLGGAAAQACGALWQRIGLPPARWANGPDHLAAHLDALAWLCGAEADAWGDDAPGEAKRIGAVQREALDLLLGWLPRWVVAVEGPWPAALACAVGELVVHHRVGLGAWTPTTAETSIPDLADAATGIREIAEFLTAPHRSGLLLTAAALARLGRGLDLPGGFGPRRQRLGNLLRAAARFDHWAELIDGLDALTAQAAARLAGPPWSVLGPAPGSQLDHTRGLLAALRSAGLDVADEG